MNPYFAIVSLLLVHCACAEELKAFASEEGDSGHKISPKLQPKSDSKFFGKDYPLDKRPPVDVFHFKHPYPAVQDSGDFDADYVKDENSDDGSWKAQSEYDRLRHKLRKEKADVAKALAAKEDAEKELQRAMKAEKEWETRTTPAPPKVVQEDGESSPGQTGSSGTKVTKAKVPGGIANPGDVKVATDDTQKAMDALEECKKQLAAAREKLKEMMDELEAAKKRQVETQEALDAALARRDSSVAEGKARDKGVKDQYQEYMDARTEYLKQQALLAKMEADIKVAAEKVRRMRDAEDKDGGVYNTPGEQKSGARSLSGLLLAVLAAAACISQ